MRDELQAELDSRPTPLEKVIYLRALVDLCERQESDLKAQANSQFMTLYKDGSFTIAGAEIKPNTPKRMWTYPPAVAIVEAELDKIQKEAKADGTATAMVKIQDPNRDTMFTVKLTEGAQL